MRFPNKYDFLRAIDRFLPDERSLDTAEIKAMATADAVKAWAEHNQVKIQAAILNLHALEAKMALLAIAKRQAKIDKLTKKNAEMHAHYLISKLQADSAQ